MSVSRRVSLLRSGGRLLVAALLVLALVPPPLPWSRAAMDFMVLVDESRSMPTGFVDAAWEELGSLMEDAPPGSHLRLLRFAATTALELDRAVGQAGVRGPLPRSSALDGTSTDIAAAMQQALHLLPADRPSRLILVSDGAATRGDTDQALALAGKAGVPVYLMPPAAGSMTPQLSLLDLQAPARVNEGEVVPVMGRVHSRSGGSAQLVLSIDGEPHARQQVELSPGEQQTVSFRFVPDAAGVRLVSLGLVVPDAAGSVKPPGELTRAVTVQGPLTAVLVSRRTGMGQVPQRLRYAGWQLSSLSPSEFAARLPQLDTVGTVVLDDIAIDDLGAGTWQALVDAVRHDGVGLAILGGARSFGAGAYRHSILEQILPVTAEAPDPEEAAAVMFVLDTSGSMGRKAGGASRFALARRAVLDSAQLLAPQDSLGVITFSAAAESRLALLPHASALARLPQALDIRPVGGTRLGPALELAAEQLFESEASQRLIVLVTDGFTGDENLQGVAQLLRGRGVTVIALAVGGDPDQATLRQLTAFNGGALLPVGDVTRLPQLMPQAVAGQRAPPQAGPSPTVQARALPFPPGLVPSWPPVQGYMVTTARPAADVYLRSAGGDPLLAAGFAGAGRVAVLPAGLGAWATAWRQWPQADAFLSGLLRWLDPGFGDRHLSIEVRDGPGELQFDIDLLADDTWQVQVPPRLSVFDPAGVLRQLSPELQAPGRYRAVMPATMSGLYRATVHAAGRSTSSGIYRNPAADLVAPEVVTQALERWYERGWVKPWTGADTVIRNWPGDTGSARRDYLLLAACVFLLLMLMERGIPGYLLALLRARFAR